MIRAVLAGSTAGLTAAVASDHSMAAALVAGAVVALAVLVALMRFQRSVWKQAATTPLIADENGGPS